MKLKTHWFMAVAGLLLVIVVLAVLASPGLRTITPEQISNGLGWVLIA